LQIAIVTQYYKPEDAKIPNGIAQELARRGHQVRVVTGYPNYPEGRLYAGFRQRLVHYENDGGVRVRRVPLVISHSQNSIARFANYASFAVSTLLAGRFVRNADVIYVYATQMTAAFGPSVWTRTRGIPFVLHIQDLWPDSITGSSMVKGKHLKNSLNLILKPWLSTIYRRSAAIIAIAPTMRGMLVDRGVDERKLHMVFNWAEEDSTPRGISASEEPPRQVNRLSVVYAGNLGELQDLETVVRAAALAKDLDGFTLTLVGAGVASRRLVRLVAELGATNVLFRGRVLPSEMGEIYAESDFQIIPLQDLAIFRGTIPSKFQNSIANGIPVITTVAGDVSDIVVEQGLGLVSAPGDVAALAATFARAYGLSLDERSRMGEKSRAYYNAVMSKSSGVDKIERILASAVHLSNRKKSNARSL
jgi:glycosyltransferase involved in cell wall biosynthesis